MTGFPQFSKTEDRVRSPGRVILLGSWLAFAGGFAAASSTSRDAACETDTVDAAGNPGDADPSQGTTQPSTAPRSPQPPRLQTAPRAGQAAPTAPARPGAATGATGANTSVQPPAVAPPTQPIPPSPAAPTPAPTPGALPSELSARGPTELDELAASALATEPGLYGSVQGFSSSGIPVMIGDLGAIPSLRVFQQRTGSSLPSPFPPPTPPGVPRARGGEMVIPAMRGVKISDNQSPRPQDRFYFSFNYFQGVNDQVNQKLQAPIGYTQVYREIFGFEKTFFDGQASLGIQAPLNSVTAMSAVPKQFGNYGGSSTAVGDMSIYGKVILLENSQTGSLLSGGLAICPPTGPGKFAGLNSFSSIVNTTSFQPFLGYIYNMDRFYVHGFFAVDVPANSQDVTLLYNDVGFGYFLVRPDPQSDLNPLISMVAPTFEIHVTDPLNHRDWLNPRDPAAMADIVNFTYGLNVGIRSRTVLTFGIVTPVSSPKPFDLEAMFYLNYFFGGTRRSRAQQIPPVVGN
jgi:hypothetical protein